MPFRISDNTPCLLSLYKRQDSEGKTTNFQEGFPACAPLIIGFIYFLQTDCDFK